MKRWLILMSLLVAGLLMVGWAGSAMAAKQSPSLLQRILSALTPRLTPTHHVGANKPAETRKAELPSDKPESQPVPTPRPTELRPPAAAPDPVAQMMERTQPAPEAQPDSTSNPPHTTRASKGDKLVKTPKLVAPIGAIQATDGPSLGRPEPLVETQLASEAVSKSTTQAAKKAKPPKATTPTTTSQFEVAQAVGKVVPAKPPLEAAQSVFVVQSVPSSKSVETTQSITTAPVKPTQPRQAAQPMQVAILGAPNLKAALPPENAAPVEALRPEDEPRSPAAKPDQKSACNAGRRVVSAYYWEGHHTASGQPFNPRGMTAAHRTLPFGTRLNVTNPRTGKTVNVLINDRGPFVRGVSLDLSLGAAQAIGLQGTGSVCIL
jgi:rare lipoprotein A